MTQSTQYLHHIGKPQIKSYVLSGRATKRVEGDKERSDDAKKWVISYYKFHIIKPIMYQHNTAIITNEAFKINYY